MSETLEATVPEAAKTQTKTKVVPQHGGLRVASCTLQELFSGNLAVTGGGTIRGTLTIPEYQRPYVWKEKQLNRLLRDLLDYKHDTKEDKPLYYLGSIIIHQDGDQLKI